MQHNPFPVEVTGRYDMSTHLKYRKISLRQKVNRELGAVVAKMPTPENDRGDFIQDLRRGRRRIYGGLLRYIDVAAGQGVPLDVVRRIPEVIAAYIDETYAVQR